MFRFTFSFAAGKVFKPCLLAANKGLLNTLKYRTQTFNNNWKLRTFSNRSLNISELLSNTNGDLNKDIAIDAEELFKRKLIKKSVPEMLDSAKDISDLKSAAIFVGYLCQKLGHFKDINLTELVMKDKRLLNVFSYFSLESESKEKVPDTLILNLLFSLYKLNPFHYSLITLAETHIISRIENLNENDLIRILEEYSKNKVQFKLTDSSLQLFNKSVNRVQENCKEFKNPNHLISAIYYLSKLEMPDAARNVLMQSTDLVSKFNAKQLCNILFLMTTFEDITITKFKKIKIVDLLKEFDLQHLNYKILNKLLFSCGAFNIYDTDLIESATSVLKQTYGQLETVITNNDAMFTINALGKLRWKDSELLEMALKLIEPFTLSMNSNKSIISALARLDYSFPDNMKYLTDHLYTKGKLVSPLKKLDLVWTLVVLERANAEHIASIINPIFIASVCSDLSCIEKGPKFSDVLKIQKLQNISLAGRLEFDMPVEKVLMDSYIFDLKNSFYSNSMSEMLLLVLSKIFGSEGIDSKTVIGGHFIDALLYVNSDSSIEKIDNISPENLEKCNWICIKIQRFSDTLLNEVGPTGPFRMSIRHLTKLGFKVIVVPYQLFSSKDNSDIETFIKEEMNKIVKVDS